MEAAEVAADRRRLEHMELTDGSALQAQTLLVATGRMPNSDDLGLELAGVRTDEDGRVIVDEHGRTGVEGVWALGDVSSPTSSSTWPTTRPGRSPTTSATRRTCRRFDHAAVPAAVFSHPQVAAVGLTEQQAREAGMTSR